MHKHIKSTLFLCIALCISALVPLRGARASATITAIAQSGLLPSWSSAIVSQSTSRYDISLTSTAVLQPVFAGKGIVGAPCSFLLSSSTDAQLVCSPVTGSSGNWRTDCTIQVTWSLTSGGTQGADFCAATISVSDTLLYNSGAASNAVVGTIVSGNVTIDQSNLSIVSNNSASNSSISTTFGAPLFFFATVSALLFRVLAKLKRRSRSSIL